VLALVAWKISATDNRGTMPVNPTAGNFAAVKPVADPLDPVLAVIAHGGTPLELENAIGVLDTMTRVGAGLTAGPRTALLAALEDGAPAAMADGSWSHVFNSACNVLAVAQATPDDAFLRLLERVAVDDPRLVMRLYALQHLGCNYAAASPADQQRLRALVQRLLADPASKTAGTALVLWRSWEKTAGPGKIPSLDLSRAMVTDAGRPVDVRVTALHAIGDELAVLELARAIAPDRSQPLLLRKAALNLIGRHGTEPDLTVLRLCSRENPRLAQAGEPAARVLQDRLAGIPQSVRLHY
jgi:hypothetical protein